MTLFNHLFYPVDLVAVAFAGVALFGVISVIIFLLVMIGRDKKIYKR
jgi:hypothetical protein